jgi:hypothetical protein
MKGNIMETELKKAIAEIDVLSAILTLEYHNKNYLNHYFAGSPKNMNEEQREILARIRNRLTNYCHGSGAGGQHEPAFTPRID